MNVLRGVIGMAGLALLGLVVWAIFAYADLHGDFPQQLSVIVALPWGVAALADLYVGYLIVAALVLMVERSWLSAALWAVPVFFLGNIWAALWFVIRLPVIAAALSAAAKPLDGPPGS